MQWVLLYSHVQPGGYKIKFDNIGCSKLILCKRPTVLKFGLKKSELNSKKCKKYSDDLSKNHYVPT